MKKIIFALLLLVVVFNSCKKESSKAYEVEPVHASADELMQRFMNALEGGASGWEATLNPQSGKSYTLFLSMDKSGAIATLADLDVNTARTPKFGTYKFKKGATSASISFSSGTYLDDITHKRGIRTLGSDTSYAFQYMKGDTLVLRGNDYGDELRMVNITADQVVAFERGVLGNSYIYMNNYFSQKPFFSVTTSENIPVQIGINARSRSLNLIYVLQGKLVFQSTDFAYGLNRIVFKKPIRVGQLWVSELRIDTQTGAFYISNGLGKLPLVGSSMPVIPLHLLIGSDFPPVVSLPSPIFIEELPGWSPAFMDTWFISTINMYESPLQSQLMVMAFNLDTKKELLNIDFIFSYQGGYNIATFPLSYTKSLDGTYKFSSLPFTSDTAHQNANVILPYVSPLLELVVNDSFKMDYFDAGNNTMLAQFKSLTRPQIYFTGYFRSYR
jgi:hypothetical protein